jgi:hypothetical protein
MTHIFDAFISYSRADSKSFAIKLTEELSDRGLNIWLDLENIEDSVKWQNAIARGIESSDNFIFIIAPNSISSPYCYLEIEIALKYNKRIIPLLHLESEDFWNKLHPKIAEIQLIYFEEKTSYFLESLERLINSINKQKHYVLQHTKILLQALKWEGDQKHTNHLLTCEERQEAESWLKENFRDKNLPCEPTYLHC